MKIVVSANDTHLGIGLTTALGGPVGVALSARATLVTTTVLLGLLSGCVGLVGQDPDMSQNNDADAGGAGVDAGDGGPAEVDGGPPCSIVSVTGRNATSSPSANACVRAGTRRSLTVRASDDYVLSPSSPLTVRGTCPMGGWSDVVFKNGELIEAVYTTGPIEQDCSVHFYATSSLITMPAAANAIDVTAPPYNANNRDTCATASPTQKTATTAAINAAIAAVLQQNGEVQGSQTLRYNHVVYFPPGTYCVNGPIINGYGPQPAICEVTLQGAGVRRTVIALDDSLGFSKPVITTANCTPSEVGPTTPASSGNVAFRNHINDLTVYTGRGNPQAIGVSFMGNNNAAVRNVNIVSGDGAGAVGFAANRFLNGPALVKNLSVTGFTTGVSVGGGTFYSMTFEHLQVTNQQPGGVGVKIDNRSATVAIRDLKSTQNIATVPAVSSGDRDNMLTIIDSTLTNTAGPRQGARVDAIANGGAIFVRDTKQTGYTALVNGQACAEECAMPPPTTLGAAEDEVRSLRLPIEETPYYNETDDGTLSSWIDATASHCGGATGVTCAVPNDIRVDSAPGINAALANAAPGSTVFLKQGAYYLGPNETIEIPSNVVRVVCYGATFLPLGGTTFRLGTPTFRFNSVEKESLQILEGCSQYVNYDVGWGNFFQNIGWTSLIVNNSAGTVVLKDMDGINYLNTPQAFGGRVFMENVVGGPFLFENQAVYCRQCNPETPFYDNQIHMSLKGGLLWVLGWKQETSGPALVVSNGLTTAQAEILGASIYSASAANAGSPNDSAPMIINDRAALSVAGIATLGRGGGDFGYDYDTWVIEKQDSGACMGGCRLYASSSALTPRAHPRAMRNSSLLSLYVDSLIQ